MPIGLWITGSGSIVPGNLYQKHERPLFWFRLRLLLLPPVGLDEGEGPAACRQFRRTPPAWRSTTNVRSLMACRPNAAGLKPTRRTNFSTRRLNWAVGGVIRRLKTAFSCCVNKKKSVISCIVLLQHLRHPDQGLLRLHLSCHRRRPNASLPCTGSGREHDSSQGLAQWYPPESKLPTP